APARPDLHPRGVRERDRNRDRVAADLGQGAAARYRSLMASAPERTPDIEPPEPETGPTDLGMGRVVANAVRGRFINRDGTTSSRKYGLGSQRAERVYLGALEAS